MIDGYSRDDVLQLISTVTSANKDSDRSVRAKVIERIANSDSEAVVRIYVKEFGVVQGYVSRYSVDGGPEQISSALSALTVESLKNSVQKSFVVRSLGA